jgi:hypothetical protein
MNDLIIRLAKKKNLDTSLLENLWEKAIDKQMSEAKSQEERDKGNKTFWNAVKEKFLEMVDELNYTEARLIMDARDKYQDVARQFLDAINNDNYVKAKEVFPHVIQAKADILINNERRTFLKNYSSKVNDSHKE